MTRELLEVLEQQRAMTENLQRQLKVVCPRVFHRAGRPIKSFRVAFRSACKDAGCPGRVLHDFRRTAVRNLVGAGIPERVAMQMTGHKTRVRAIQYRERWRPPRGCQACRVATGTISGTIEPNRRSGRESVDTSWNRPSFSVLKRASKQIAERQPTIQAH